MRCFYKRRDVFAECIRSDPHHHLREPVEIFRHSEPAAQCMASTEGTIEPALWGHLFVSRTSLIRLPPLRSHRFCSRASFYGYLFVVVHRATLLPPSTKLRQGNVFTPICDSVHTGVSVQGGSMSRGVSIWGSVWGGLCRGVFGEKGDCVY